jgi:thiamine biosynthesis lipoprotein
MQQSVHLQSQTGQIVRFQAMNTTIELQYTEADKEQAAMRRLAEDWFRTTANRFSRFLPQSELSALNELAGSRCLVSDAMLEVLQLAEHFREKTEAAFNPFIVEALELAGYDDSFERVKEESGLWLHG